MTRLAHAHACSPLASPLAGRRRAAAAARRSGAAAKAAEPQRARSQPGRATSPTTRPSSPTRRRARGFTRQGARGLGAHARRAARSTFTDKLNAIRVESRAARRRSPPRGAQSELPELARRSRASSPATVEHRHAHGRHRRAHHLPATRRPNPVTGKAGTDAVERYVFFHNGQRVVLTLSRARRAPTTSTRGGSSPTRVRWTAMTAPLEAESLYRFFHAGDDETLALRGVSLAVERRRARRRHRAVGLGQVDAAGLPGGPRRARRRHGARSPASGCRAAPRRSARAMRARRIGVLYQQANLVGHLSVADNVALAQRLAGAAPRRRRASVLERCGHRRAAPHARARASSPAASWRAPASPSRWPTTRRCCSPTSRPASSTTATAERVLDLLRERAARRRRRARRHPQPGGRRAPPTARSACATGGSRHDRRRAARPLRRRRRAPTAPGRRATVALQPTDCEVVAGARIALVGPVGLGQVDAAAPASPGSTSRRVGTRRLARASGDRARCGPGRSPSSSRARACCRRSPSPRTSRCRCCSPARTDAEARAARARRRSSGSASPSSPTSCPRRSPAARRSASPSRARWPASRALILADEPTGQLDRASGAARRRRAARGRRPRRRRARRRHPRPDRRRPPRRALGDAQRPARTRRRSAAWSR